MKRLFTIVLFCVLGSAGKSFALPPCPPPPGVFHLCFGSYTYTNGAKYVGEFKNGERQGQGTMIWANGNKYVGEFKDDEAWKGVEYDKGGKERFIYRIGIRLPKLW